MRIGIDISQTAYEKTGVANYLKNLVSELVKNEENDYILFFSSLRRKIPFKFIQLQKEHKNVFVKNFKFPPKFLDILWNKIHIVPIDSLIGSVDIFVTSDWTEPPLKKGKKATILYDLIVYKYPEETAQNIIAVQKRKLSLVKKETDIVFCISESTKKDAMEILDLPEKKLAVIYPGM